MHTLTVIGGGLLLLLAVVVAGRWLGGTAGAAKGALAFVPIWLVVALVNLWVGVRHAGYTVVQELPILMPVFGVPAAIAALVWWRCSAR